MASSSQPASALATARPLLPLLKELPPALRGLTFPELFFNPPGQSRRQLSSAERLALEELPELREIYLNDSGSSAPRRCFALLKGEEVVHFVVTPDRLLVLGSRADSMGDRSLFVNCDRIFLQQLFPTPLWGEIVALHSTEELLIAERSPISAFTIAAEEGPMIEALLKLGCDPHLLTSHGESLLHLALSKGSAPLVSYLLEQPSARSWLPQLEVDINAPSRSGDTPLHSAAKHGHLESARLLLDSGAQIDLINESGESPIDLALRWGQDAIAWLLIGGREKELPHFVSEEAVGSGGASSSGPGDLTGAADREFQKAHESGGILPQIFWLEKLAQLYLEGRKHPTLQHLSLFQRYLYASHFLNGALFLVLNDPSDLGKRREILKKLILSQLERVEKLFLEDKYQIKSQERRNDLIFYRERLESIRLQFAEQLSRGIPIKESQEFLTENYQALLIALIEEAIVQIGEERPSGFAVMGLGSMARMEMCPYSDLEFAFLIDDSSEEKLDYFRKLSELLALKMVNMGETEFRLIQSKQGGGETGDPSEKSLVPAGFRLDIGGLCPLGKEGLYELIGTPQELARLQTTDWLSCHDSEIILVNALTLFSHIMGESDLVDRYRYEVNRILNSNVGGWLPWNWKELRKGRALELMQSFFDEFQPKIDQDKVDERAFGVKKELYRLSQTVISGLSLYYDLRGTNTLERIEGLQRAGVLSSEGGDRLRRVFNSILKLRAETHLFYGTEKEILYHPRVEERGEERLFIISPELGEQLLEIYRTLIPLYQGLRAFLAGDSQVLASSPLYDSSIGVYDDRLREELDYEAALKAAQGMVALKPDSSSQWNLGLVHLDMGQARKALQSLKEVQGLLEKEHGDAPHPDIVISLMNLGSIHLSLGEYGCAIDFYKKSLLMRNQIYVHRADFNAATCLMNLANAYYGLCDYALAIEYYKQSLAMKKQAHGNTPHSEVAAILNNLGNVYRDFRDYNCAIDYYVQSLTMKKQIYGERSHPDLAISLMNLGNIYYHLCDYARAIGYYEQSLEMKKQIYGDRPNTNVADSLITMGNASESLGNYDRAIEYHTQSLEIFKEIYGDRPHPKVAMSLNNLGFVYSSLADYTRAIKLYEQSLKINKKIYKNKPHRDIATNLGNLGNSYSSLGKYTCAINYNNQSLEMRREIYGDRPHPEVASNLEGLGSAWNGLNDYFKAIDFQGQSLAMRKVLYGDRPHRDVASSLVNLGNVYYSSGEYKLAIDQYKQSLTILKEIYGEGFHSDVAMNLSNLGEALYALGDYTGAIDYHRQSLGMRRRIHGDRHHFNIAISLDKLGQIYYSLKEWDDAKKCYEESLAIFKRVFGSGIHLYIAKSLNNLAGAYKAMKDYSLAVKYYEDSLMIFRELFDERPDLTFANTLNNLGDVYFESGLYRLAVDFYEQSLAMLNQLDNELGGEPFMSTAPILNNLGKIYCSWEGYGRATDYYKQLLGLFKQIYLGSPEPGVVSVLRLLENACFLSGDYRSSIQYGEEAFILLKEIHGDRPHLDLAISLDSCGRAHRALKEFSEVVKFYEASLATYQQIYNGQPHSNIAGTLINLADGYNSLGQFDRAIECSNASLEMYRQLSGDGFDANTAINYENLGDSYKGLGQFDRAVEAYTQSLEVYTQTVGEDHPNVAQVMESLAIALRLIEDSSNQQGEQN